MSPLHGVHHLGFSFFKRQDAFLVNSVQNALFAPLFLYKFSDATVLREKLTLSLLNGGQFFNNDVTSPLLRTF